MSRGADDVDTTGVPKPKAPSQPRRRHRAKIVNLGSQIRRQSSAALDVANAAGALW
ncbi:MAG: hypothetical protein CYPHOPRED_003011 [Cyphobasidiales sp. Tagirdzhanova-0007]|nr:MAG: hypothetical protein CYPHOPRED_003011 [Cyphobasidiales sp. Tagirdzhanova-0007]